MYRKIVELECKLQQQLTKYNDNTQKTTANRKTHQKEGNITTSTLPDLAEGNGMENVVFHQARSMTILCSTFSFK